MANSDAWNNFAIKNEHLGWSDTNDADHKWHEQERQRAEENARKEREYEQKQREEETRRREEDDRRRR